MKTTKENEIIIFKIKDGPAVDVQINNETAWLNQNQMTDLFGKEKDQSFKSSLSTIYQTFEKKELYPSIEKRQLICCIL